jgi:hypothetical protein
MVEIIALVLLPLAVCIVGYSLVVFVWRNSQIAMKQAAYIDDRRCRAAQQLLVWRVMLPGPCGCHLRLPLMRALLHACTPITCLQGAAPAGRHGGGGAVHYIYRQHRRHVGLPQSASEHAAQVAVGATGAGGRRQWRLSENGTVYCFRVLALHNMQHCSFCLHGAFVGL